jgi:NADH dehydrogenase FAD-containing subunit
MGCQASTASDPSAALLPFPNANGKKTVVIVGFSIAGFTVGEQLWDFYNVVFVDQRDHFEYWPGNLKQSVDGTIKDRVITPFADTLKAYNNAFQFVQGRLLNVQKETNIIEVADKDNKKGTLQYDVLVISTGFTYANPIKSNNVYTVQGRKNNLETFSKQVDEAKNIAIVGSGIVAIELTGEIAYHAKAAEKKISLLVRGEKLLGQFDAKAGQAAEEQLK